MTKPKEPEMSLPDLKAAVAVKVMGWKWYKNPSVIFSLNQKRSRYYLGVSPYHPGDEVVDAPGDLFIDWDRDVPDYSTDIAAAWTVVEVIKEDCEVNRKGEGIGFEVHYTAQPFLNGQEPWAVTMEADEMGSVESVRGKTFPEAVCKAALVWWKRGQK